VTSLLRRGWVRPLMACALGLGAVTAHAALFEDDEARKAILELRTRVKDGDDATKARLAELTSTSQQLNETVQQLRRSLLDLNNQLEVMRGELARLRGNDEQLLRDMTELQKRQKDAAQGLDDRVRKLEPQKVSIDGSEFVAEPDERRAYDDAMAILRAGDFDKAVSSFASFQRRYPKSGYGPSVQFWLGNAQYGKRDYRDAIASFRAFIAGSPQHPRAPEAMLALANSQAEMKDRAGARKTLDELIRTHPQSEAATAGKERLASLK
jgi:tol-pal system protein YbgF